MGGWDFSDSLAPPTGKRVTTGFQCVLSPQLTHLQVSCVSKAVVSILRVQTCSAYVALAGLKLTVILLPQPFCLGLPSVSTCYSAWQA